MENYAIGIRASTFLNLEIFWKLNLNQPKIIVKVVIPQNKNTHGAVSNPLVTKQVKSADDFLEMYKNLIGLPYDFRNSNITEIKSYCRSNGYYFSDKGYYIQISNPVTKIFGQNFEVRIHELDVNLNGVGKPSKMYLEWYSTPYFSYEKMNSEFKNFTDEIERCGGILQGYDEI